MSREVFLIAEIGKNFIQTEDKRPVAEYLQNAKELVREAKKAGADAVKFQTHEVEDEQLPVDVVSPHFKGSDRYGWVKRNTEATPLDTFWKPLKKFCDEQGILFFSTPMSRGAAKKLAGLGVELWKIGSGDVEDHVMLDYVLETKKPVIISSGMVSLEELDRVVEHIISRGGDLTILYCISQYPAPKEYFNLSSIEYFKERYAGARIGFSDHSLGYDVALAAVKLGAKVIEKHFSLSRDLWGSDHKVSMTPAEFKNMAQAIRKGDYRLIDPAPYYGFKKKELEGANNQFRPYFNKSLMAGTKIAKGAVITKDMVYAMRPRMYADGMPSNCYYDVIGKRAKKSFERYDPITENSIQ